VDAGLDGAVRDPLEFRDLVVPEAEHVAQGDRLGQLGPQTGQRVEQVQAGGGDHAGAARVGQVGQLRRAVLGRD
jgi:hypothetical protein